MPLTKSDALKILEKNNCPENILEHAKATAEKAVEISQKIQENGHKVDVDFVETASLLHDLGRCHRHDIKHGEKGAELLKDHPEYARVCETHIGGGITSGEAKELGLTEIDYLPETLEEKIICIADKLTKEDRYIEIDEALGIFREKLGGDHPTIKRIKELYDELSELAGQRI